MTLWAYVLETIGHRIRFGHWPYAVAVADEPTPYLCYRRSCGFANLRFPSLA